MSGLLIGFAASLLANLAFSIAKIGQAVGQWKRRRTLYRFWGRPRGARRAAYLYYPGYPHPRVGRTQKGSGHYVSDEDARGVEQLHDALIQLGFQCERRAVTGLPDVPDRFPEGATVVLICDPKLDQTNGQITYDPFIGGNVASSVFYLKYCSALKIELRYNRDEHRNEYVLPNKDEVHSPMDKSRPQQSDRGLLIRFIAGNGTLFVLCWGIHAYATLAAVDVATCPSQLSQLPLQEKHIGATLEAHFHVDHGIHSIRMRSFRLESGPYERRYKPDPFAVEKWLPPERPLYGFSYLWATRDNMDAVQSGAYDSLRPVAAELDLSLRCVYDCPWCAYAGLKTGEVLGDPEQARRIVERLAECGVRLLVLTGGGEPLVSPCLKAVVEHPAAHGMLVVLYTNGYLLDDLRAYHLMSRGMAEIRVTLDDVSSPQAYARVHGLREGETDALATVRNNCSHLLELRAKLGLGTRIGLSFLASDDTIGNLTQSAAVLKEWVDTVGPFDYVVIRPAVRYWRQSVPAQHYFTASRRDLRDKLSMVDEAAAAFGANGVARHVLVSRQRFEDVVQEQVGQAYDRCLGAPLWLNIGPDGSAYLCCETKHMSDFRVGNILTQKPEEILSNPLYERKREIPWGTAGCPTRLCKPSAINALLNNIESKRGHTGELPADTVNWLNAMREQDRMATLANALIPSVSGIYEEHSR